MALTIISPRLAVSATYTETTLITYEICLRNFVSDMNARLHGGLKRIELLYTSIDYREVALETRHIYLILDKQKSKWEDIFQLQVRTARKWDYFHRKSMKVFDKWSQIGEPKTVALLEVWNELQHNKALPQDAHFCCMTDTGRQKKLGPHKPNANYSSRTWNTTNLIRRVAEIPNKYTPIPRNEMIW